MCIFSLLIGRRYDMANEFEVLKLFQPFGNNQYSGMMKLKKNAVMSQGSAIWRVLDGILQPGYWLTIVNILTPWNGQKKYPIRTILLSMNIKINLNKPCA